MKSPSERIKLPEIHTSLSIPDMSHNSGFKSPLESPKLPKGKPTYLARKIKTEELFGNNYLGQINEEKLAEIEDVDMVESMTDLAEDKKDTDNIFKKDFLVSSKYKEHDKGPAYSKSGHLVKHSIVGSTEMFERQQRMLKKQHVKDNNGNSFDKDSMSEMSTSRVMKTMNSINAIESSTPTNRLLTQSGMQNISFQKKKEGKSKVNLSVTKAEILNKIEKMRDLQAKFYADESEKYAALPLGDQLYQTRQKRCMEKYNEMLDTWNDTSNFLNYKSKRTNGKSVIYSSDDYREKIEQAKAFNIAQPEEERLGQTIWYMTLRRNSKNHDTDKQRMIADIPDGFNSPQITRPESSLEIIRKPVKISKANIVLPPLNETKYLQRTWNEYVQDKSISLKSELSKIMTTNFTNSDDFLIEGKNKLEMEIDAFFHVNKEKNLYVVPKHFLQERKPDSEEEYLARDYRVKDNIKAGLTISI